MTRHEPRAARRTSPTRPRRALGIAVILALGACDEGGTGISGALDAGGDATINDTQAPLPDPQNPAFQPEIGIWNYTDGGLAENDCGDLAVRDANTAFVIRESTDGRFRVGQNEDAGDFWCVIRDATFTCPSRLVVDVPVGETDAVIRYDVRIDGTLSSDRALSGTQTADLTCRGASCALAPSVLGVRFPCTYTVAFSATRY